MTISMRSFMILFIGTLSLKLSTVNTSFCFWNSGCSYKYFASKTPYNSIRGDIRDSFIKLKDCEPISIWALYKNGKRYPSEERASSMKAAEVIRDYIVDSFDKGNCSLCAQDVENLKSWSIDREIFKGVRTLTNEGSQEVHMIAKRLKKKLPNLLDNLREREYRIGATSEDKIEESAKAYADGFAENLVLDKDKIDDIVAPYVSCGKYQDDVKKNPEIYEEAAKYLKSPEYFVVKDRIQRRTGLDIKLTNDNITALYDLCRYTWSGADGKTSPWCALFTSEDLQVLEYVEDLKLYYRDGYGTPTNELLGRIPLADLLESFQQAKLGEGRKITAYFGRSTALDTTLSALGLFKDKVPLTGGKRNKSRKWRSWKLSAFSSNIMVILSKCDVNGKDDFAVVFYLNEHPLKSICNEGICSWSEFENRIMSFASVNTDFCGKVNLHSK